jgi:hypothetical protein
VLSNIRWFFVELILTAVEFHCAYDGDGIIHDVGGIRDAGRIHGETTTVTSLD